MRFSPSEICGTDRFGAWMWIVCDHVLILEPAFRSASSSRGVSSYIFWTHKGIVSHGRHVWKFNGISHRKMGTNEAAKTHFPEDLSPFRTSFSNSPHCCEQKSTFQILPSLQPGIFIRRDCISFWLRFGGASPKIYDRMSCETDWWRLSFQIT
jgi:hypothetical protein